MGHALFLTLQDSLTRFYRAMGIQTLWLPGLDHAGLATHEKILAYKQENPDKTYEHCAQYIEKAHKKIILEQIQQLGAMPDWELLTYTMDEEYKTFALNIFNLLIEENLIFKQENDLFMDMSALALELKKDIEADIIKITPQKECAELFHFLDNIKPWCLTRQIPWGLELPLDIKSRYGFKAEDAICLDTWFNSSLWPLACLINSPDLIDKFYPAELIETGADILFFWCAKMLMMGSLIYKHKEKLGLNLKSKYPFHQIYLHGLIRDKNNRKFSKSLGNGIDPLDMIAKYGADSLRLFLASRTGPAEDMKFNEQDLPGIRKFMNKIWNCGRFFSMHMEQLNANALPAEFEMDTAQLREIQDRFIGHMENFRFLEASREIQHDIKAWFCDKWIEENKQAIKDGNTQKLYEGLYIFKQLLALLQAFCPFICDKLSQSLFKLDSSL